MVFPHPVQYAGISLFLQSMSHSDQVPSVAQYHWIELPSERVTFFGFPPPIQVQLKLQVLELSGDFCVILPSGQATGIQDPAGTVQFCSSSVGFVAGLQSEFALTAPSFLIH
jgi:hypothetical protein